MARSDLSDEESAVIGELLPSERGRKARPSHDNRRFLDGMLLVLRAGCPWRHMHERYGKWNSVYVRFRRWAQQGIWDAMLETLVELGLTDDWQHMIHSTTVRGHSQAAALKDQRHQTVHAAAKLDRLRRHDDLRMTRQCDHSVSRRAPTIAAARAGSTGPLTTMRPEPIVTSIRPGAPTA